MPKNTKKLKYFFLVNNENYLIFALAITEKKFLQILQRRVAGVVNGAVC